MAGKYDGLSAAQLTQLLEKRDRQKKLGLVWERDEIEADIAVDESFIACQLVEELCEHVEPWSNLIIEGDNFDALRWLRMTSSSNIDCIYIDPPYNTGNKDWVYNDHFMDPKDKYKHSTWLEFIYRRISLARDLLAENGVILVSINDENRARLELLLEEALPGMRIGSFVWRTKDSSNDADRNLSSVHEHVLAYGNKGFEFLGGKLSDKKYRHDDGDGRGKYSADPITKAHSYTQRPGTYYPIQDPKTGWWYPCNPDSVWRYASEKKRQGTRKLRSDTIEGLIRDNRIIFPATEHRIYKSKRALLSDIQNERGPVDGNGRQLLRKDLPDIDFWINKPIALGRPSKKSYWNEKKTNTNRVSSFILGTKEKKSPDLFELTSEKQGKATGEIQKLFGARVFDYPKPVTLIKSLLEVSTGPDSTVLDFFAGSGTTAQAVMELNEADGGTRKFILVSSTEATTEDKSRNLCRDITAARVRRINKLETEEYAELQADFAYLQTKKILYEDLDYDLTPKMAWTALEMIHRLPLTLYDTDRTWQRHTTDDQTLVLVDELDDSLVTWLKEGAQRRSNTFIYSWAPGLLIQQLGKLDFEIRSVRDTLVKRAQQ